MDSDPDSAKNLLHDPSAYQEYKPNLYPSPPSNNSSNLVGGGNNNNSSSNNAGPHQFHSNNHLIQSQPGGGGCGGGGGGGMTNKTYAASAAGGAGGVAVNFADTARLQRRVARLTSYLYGLAVVVIVGGVILIAIIASLYAKLYYDLTHHSHQPKVGEQIAKILEREELCVLCSEVRLGPSPHEESMLDIFTKRDSKDGQKCCVERPAELLRLLELYIEKTYREEMAKGNIKIRHTGGTPTSGPTEKPAAHLMGYPNRHDQSQSTMPGSQFPIGRWIHEEDLAFTNHVTYRHGRIVVPDSGLYYVYSQVDFLELLHSNGASAAYGRGRESPSLSHYLYRYNIIYPNGGEETLIQNSITKCYGPNQEFGEYTSYLGAVFNLRQGDEVFVKVSNLSMVAMDPKSTYFGLFKV